MRRIDNREFVIAYMTARTSVDVEKAMSLTRQQVASKATYLRKQGVRLPKLRNQITGSLDIAQLNSLILKHQKQK